MWVISFHEGRHAEFTTNIAVQSVYELALTQLLLNQRLTGSAFLGRFWPMATRLSTAIYSGHGSFGGLLFIPWRHYVGSVSFLSQTTIDESQVVTRATRVFRCE